VADYRNQCGDPKDDPGADQLRWLAAQLKDAAAKKDKVWLLYHIPYGIDAYNSVIAPGGNKVEKVVSLWQPGYTEKFLILLDQYRDTILSMLAGHTHMDYFRLGPYRETGPSSTFLLRPRPSRPARKIFLDRKSALSSHSTSLPRSLSGWFTAPYFQ
jgi:sphingomyelin phosphodiesterase acid-like 3